MATAVRAERVRVAPGVTLHVEIRSGATGRLPLVLVHGLASNLRLWDGVAERLAARGHPVVAVDQRGHGQSDAPDTGYDLDTAATDLLAVVRALGLAHPVLVGQSWGGNVVVELGARHPDAVAGLAGIDGGLIELADVFPSWEACLAALTPPALDGLTPAALEARVREAYPGFPEPAVAAVLANFRQQPGGTLEPRLARPRHLAILQALWDHRPSAGLARLAVPLLLLYADTGDARMTAAKRRAEVRALAVVPRIRSVWRQAHHDVHAQDPEWVADTLGHALGEGYFA